MACANVQNSRLTPAVGKAQTYHPSIPFIAHKKLTNVTTPVPHNSVRKTVISNALDRIQHKPRSHQSYDPMEDFLNERSVTSFEDVTRSIRANTAALLKKVHTPVPRSVKPLSVSNLYNHTETPIADRISSDEYIWHLLRPLPGKPSNGIDVGYYPESSTKIPLGKTHLACLSYAGGHPIAKRRQLVAGAGDDYRNVRNDVELLSHYTRMRQAANQPHENGIASTGASNSGASRFKHNAPTTPHTTEKVTTNGPVSATLSEDDKENIAVNAQKSLKKKPSRDISVDEDQKQRDQEKALREKQAAEEERERLEQERKAEEERLEQERIAEDERKAEQERLEEEERKAEQERLEQERKAEEERLEQERLAEEERLAREEEEKQRLLEEKLVEEYHREQERLAEEKRKREQEFAEEQQKLAQQKLAEEQKLLHEKLLEIKQQQEAEEENVEKDEDEEEEADEKSEPVQIQEVVDENETEYVKCNNIPKNTDETDKNESSEEEESEEASDEEPAIAENVQQNGSVEVDEVVVIKKTIRSTIEFEQEFGAKSFDKNEDEKSENTDANSDISEAEEELNNSTVPELNNAENKDQNESKENKEEEETEEEDEEEEEEEEEE